MPSKTKKPNLRQNELIVGKLKCERYISELRTGDMYIGEVLKGKLFILSLRSHFFSILLDLTSLTKYNSLSLSLSQTHTLLSFFLSLPLSLSLSLSLSLLNTHILSFSPFFLSLSLSRIYIYSLSLRLSWLGLSNTSLLRSKTPPMSVLR